MKFIRCIDSVVLSILVLGTISILLVGIVPIHVEKSNWKSLSHDHISSVTLNSSVTKLNYISSYIDIYFNGAYSDIITTNNYITNYYKNKLNVVKNYTTYYGVSSIDSRVPPKDNLNQYFASSTFKTGTTSLSQLYKQNHVNESSIFDNLFRQIYKSSDLYVSIYTGFDNGLYRIYPYFKLNSYPTFSYTCYYNNQPTVGYDPRCRVWYVIAQGSDDVKYTSPYVDALTNQVLITISSRIFVNGQTYGVIGFDFVMTELDKLISNSKILTNGYVFLIDSNGLIISYPALDRSSGTRNIANVENGIDGAIWNNVINSKLTTVQSITVVNKGSNWNMLYKYIPNVQYVLVMMYPQSDVDIVVNNMFDNINTNLTISTVIILFCVVSLWVVVFYVTRKLGRYYAEPFIKLANTLRAIGQANLDIETGNTAPVSSEINIANENIANLLNAVRFGNEAYYSGNLQKALESYIAAHALMEKNKNYRGLSVCTNNEANVYKQLGNYAKAIELYNKSIDYVAKIEQDTEDKKKACQVMIAYRYMNLGVLHKDNSDFTKAEEFLVRSLELAKKCDDAKGIAEISGNLGQLYLQIQNTRQATELITNALEICRLKNDETSLQYATINMGFLKAFLNDFESPDGAIYWFSLTLRKTKNIDIHIQNKCVDNLCNIYSGLGRTDKLAELNEIAGKSRMTSYLQRYIKFLLDVSGSMAGNPIAQCQKSIINIINNHLEPEDTISLTTFCNASMECFTDLRKGDANNYNNMINIINGLSCGGGTLFYNTLYNAINNITISNARNEWIIALTDGEDNQSTKDMDKNIIKLLNQKPVNLIIMTIGALSTRDTIQRFIDTVNQKNSTKKGYFIEIGKGDNAIYDAFQKVARLISGHLHVESL
uniref:VWFA domain-containing protein n=1 Tax=viral metagenome TaxID=1070528 RepID=A0A6C0EBL0_9ZZZZ